MWPLSGSASRRGEGAGVEGHQKVGTVLTPLPLTLQVPPAVAKSQEELPRPLPPVAGVFKLWTSRVTRSPRKELSASLQEELPRPLPPVEAPRPLRLKGEMAGQEGKLQEAMLPEGKPGEAPGETQAVEPVKVRALAAVNSGGVLMVKAVLPMAKTTDSGEQQISTFILGTLDLAAGRRVHQVLQAHLAQGEIQGEVYQSVFHNSQVTLWQWDSKGPAPTMRW